MKESEMYDGGCYLSIMIRVICWVICWQQHLFDELREMGFEQFESDECVFF
jgi:hypothetical protein